MHKTRILIVEDEAIVARDISSQLMESGYEPVGQTATGEQALILAEQLRPDLVLMDVSLAGRLDGIAAAQSIREQFSIPVVFLTAYLADTVLDRAKAAQPYGYLTKPFQSVELRMAVDLAFTRHLAETQMRQAHDEQAAILRSAIDGFWMVDAQTRLLEVNEAYCRMSGYSREELLRMSIGDLNTVRSSDEIAAHIERIKQAGSARFESRHRRKDGCIMDVESSVNYTPASGGRFFCFVRDITERKRLEEVQTFLAQHGSGTAAEPFFNALARFLAHSLGMDFVCIDRLEGDGLSARTVAVWCDGHFEDNVVYALKDTPCGDVVGQTVCCFPAKVCQFFPRDTVLLDLRAESYAGVTLWSHEGQPIGLIAVIGRTPLPNRSLVEIILKLVAVRAAGELERLDAEEALRKSEAHFRGYYELGLIGMAITSPQKGWVQFNDYLCAMLGYAREELQRMTWSDLTHPEDLGADLVLFQRVMSGNIDSYSIDKRFIQKGGGVIYASLSVQCLRHKDGLVDHFVAMVQDITERKRAEVEKEKLEAQNRQLQKSESLGRMAGAIAHHFNNQLMAVMMNLQMAMETLPRHEASADNLAEAMLSARKAAEVSSRMLTYLGQTDAKRAALDLSDACRLGLSLLRAIVPQNVVLNADLPGPGPVIDGNASQIQQILTNLATNAWESCGGRRGAIHLTVVTVSAIDIPAAIRFPIDYRIQHTAYACLEVADSGSGIPDNDIEKLFEPFFSTKFTGRGLGLPVVLGIVRAHQGLITVESQLGSGSVFRVFLPVLAEPPQKPIAASHASRPADCGTMLLVEDEPVLRKVVAAAIKGLGFTVLEAQDGSEAVEIFKQHCDEIRVVLCDLTMPRMDGWETLAALRQLAPGIPFILSSGYGEAQTMEGSHPERPQAFLSKPYEFEALGEALYRALEGGQECPLK